MVVFKLYRWSLIPAAAAAALSLVLDAGNPYIAAGIAAGCVLSFFNIRLLKGALEFFIGSGGKAKPRLIFWYVLGFAFVMAIMAVAISIDIKLLLGIGGGMASYPLTILVAGLFGKIADST